MTEKRIKRQKLGGFGANFLEENLERAILTREILIIGTRAPLQIARDQLSLSHQKV